MQEVKAVVNRFLVGFNSTLARPLCLLQQQSDQHISQLSSQLLDGLKGDKLHWRAAIMTHAWFNLVSPTPGEGDMMLEMLRVQMRQALTADMLLVKV